MTVQGELSGGAQALEYLACIEGIGWPSDPHDLSAGWQGTIITTADLNGDLASILMDATEAWPAPTVVGGLTPPAAFSDSFEPTTMEYSAGGIDLDVMNVDHWLDDVITPRKKTEQNGVESTGVLMVDLTYQSTTVDIQWSNPGGTTAPFVEGDVAWIAGREAILLGARSVNGAGYRYASCTRGYLGTSRGPWDSRASWQGQRVYRAGINAYPWCQFWRGRRVMILVHVPGETRGNCERLFSGRLTGIQRQDYGTVWVFGATADAFLGRRRTREVPHYIHPGGIGAEMERIAVKIENADESSSDGLTDYAIYYMYRYRTVPGGAELPAVTEYAPQAETGEVVYQETGQPAGGTNVNLIQTLVKIDDILVMLLAQPPSVLGGPATVRWCLGERISQKGTSAELEEGSRGLPVHWLLDNLSDEAWANRFTVNGTVRRNVVDVALIWMTSCDSEFFRGDAIAGGTTVMVVFADQKWDTDQWVGYALHCVEGDNKGEARIITANTNDTLTVDTPFSSAAHNGNEYQIRNSIYDVLPWSWGLEFHNQDVNIAAWEALRDRYLGWAEVGNFAVGDDPDMDYWDLLVENIFKPYGIVCYLDRATGKLTPRYAFSLTVDASFEAVIDVSDSDLLPGSLSTIDLMPRQPTTRIEIGTRRGMLVLAPPRTSQRFSSYGGDPSPSNEPEEIVTYVAGDAELGQEQAERATLRVNAMLNNIQHLEDLGALQYGRLRDLAKPCYETTIYLRTRTMLSVQAARILSITSSATGVRDPFTGVAGLSSVPACVLSSRIRIQQGGGASIECRVQLLDPVESTRIAPAADVVDKGVDGAAEYFEVDPDRYVDEPSDYAVSDFMLFRADDRIELRDKTGAVKEGPLVVVDFGLNHTTDPTAATEPYVFVVGVIASAIVAGDYLTFAPWSDDSTANMELYSAYADATDEELGSGDAPKEYL